MLGNSSFLDNCIELADADTCAALDAFLLVYHMWNFLFAGDRVGRAVLLAHAAGLALVFQDRVVEQALANARRAAFLVDMRLEIGRAHV
jgi:hypothetical protein